MHLKYSDSSSRSAFIEMLQREYMLLFAVIFAAGLRLYQLPGQILFGDEWHAIFAATHLSYSQILSSFGISDHSIPIALYYKLALDSVGLEECIIRIPFAFAGTLTVLALPLLVRRFVGRFTSNLFAWLLALSPPLIFYSRFARPYSISLLCGFVAVIMFFRWWTAAPNWRPALLYAIFASASAYFLLVTLPFVLGPFLFFLALSLRSSWPQLSHSIKRLACLGFFTLLSISLLLGPPLYCDFEAISNKASHSVIQASVLTDAFRILTGMESPILVIMICILAITGLIKMYRQEQPLAIYLLTLSLIQPVILLILRPIGANAPHILARYLLLALPALLIFAAAGVEAISTVFHGQLRKWVGTALPVGLCIAFFLGGPITSTSYRPNNATSLIMLIHALKGKGYQQVLKRVPKFYKTIAALPPASLTIAESPFNWPADHLPLYQEIHRQNIVMGLTSNLCGQKGTIERSMLRHAASFKTIVDLKNIRALLKEGINFVVFHKHLGNEIRGHLPDYIPQDISSCVEKYRAWFGMPVFEDEDIIVFEVTRG